MKYVCEVCGYVYDPAEGDPTMVFSQEQLLRIYPMTGYAPPVV